GAKLSSASTDPARLFSRPWRGRAVASAVANRHACEPQSRHERGSPRGMKNLCRLPPWFEDVGIVNGTSKSAQSLTRELEEPRIVAASTPSRIFDDKLLRTT